MASAPAPTPPPSLDDRRGGGDPRAAPHPVRRRSRREYEETEGRSGRACTSARRAPSLADADGRPVLGCDTEVVCEGRVYGKPRRPGGRRGDAREPSGPNARSDVRPRPDHADVGRGAARSDTRDLSRPDTARPRPMRWRPASGRARARRLRDPGPGCGPRRADRGRLPSTSSGCRRRCSLACSRSASRGRTGSDERGAVSGGRGGGGAVGSRSDDPRVLRDALARAVHLRPLPSRRARLRAAGHTRGPARGGRDPRVLR